jgi:hypothetical protein
LVLFILIAFYLFRSPFDISLYSVSAAAGSASPPIPSGKCHLLLGRLVLQEWRPWSPNKGSPPKRPPDGSLHLEIVEASVAYAGYERSGSTSVGAGAFLDVRGYIIIFYYYVTVIWDRRFLSPSRLYCRI